jgi:hypothetical protein
MVAGIVLTLGTDFGLHAAGVFPALGQAMSSELLAIATAYRTVYSVVGSYITARLAPNRPIQHALVGGVVGLVVSIAGAVATWNRGLGPHWYGCAGGASDADGVGWWRFAVDGVAEAGAS